MDKFNHNIPSNKNKHFIYDERCYLQRRLGVDSIFKNVVMKEIWIYAGVISLEKK